VEYCEGVIPHFFNLERIKALTFAEVIGNKHFSVNSSKLEMEVDHLKCFRLFLCNLEEAIGTSVWYWDLMRLQQLCGILPEEHGTP
jgi:glucuronate isomerase